MATPDLTYRPGPIFARFLAHTPAGESAWREIARHTDGSGAVLAIHLAATLRQLRSAGYSVRRAAPGSARFTRDDAALLDELGI